MVHRVGGNEVECTACGALARIPGPEDEPRDASVRNGRGTCAPVTEDIRSYPVRIEGGRVFLQMSD